ncbi:MAG: ferredoxin [Clostridiales bacterium]|nr:ferredoxin [Clostridiales bacterium]
MRVAQNMIAAAVTAPKGCGIDNIAACIIDGKEKDVMARHMRDIARETGADFFERDAGNLDNSHCVVVIGVKNNPILLEDCSLCGFKDCAQTIAAGANCAFNITDMGIAIGSAVSVAADNRIDNRVLFSAGKAALRMNLLGDDVNICFGIPLSTSSKSIFFDRDPGAVLV